MKDLWDISLESSGKDLHDYSYNAQFECNFSWPMDQGINILKQWDLNLDQDLGAWAWEMLMGGFHLIKYDSADTLYHIVINIT